MTDTVPDDAAAEPPWRLRFRRALMNTSFEIILHGDRDEQELRNAADSAFEEAARLEKQLSVFVPSSDVCWINETAHRRPVRVEPDLFDLLQEGAAIHGETEGAFDITVGPLMRCWGFDRRQPALPAPEDLEAAQEHVGMEHVVLDTSERTVYLTREGVQLNLGGLGKGYVVDRVVQHLREWEIGCALVHSGGSSVYALGSPPHMAGWRVGVLDPRDRSRRLGAVTLRDRALCTSGNWEQSFVHEGETYGHLLDPRTGHPARGVLSATAIAASAARADALATAFFVMGAEKAEEYCLHHTDAAILVAQDGAQNVRIYEFGCALERGTAGDDDA